MKNVDFLSTLNHIGKKGTQIICEIIVPSSYSTLTKTFVVRAPVDFIVLHHMKKACAFIQHFSTQFQ